MTAFKIEVLDIVVVVGPVILALLFIDVVTFIYYVNQAAVYASPKGGEPNPFFSLNGFSIFDFLKLAVAVVSVCDMLAVLLLCLKKRTWAFLLIALKIAFLTYPRFAA